MEGLPDSARSGAFWIRSTTTIGLDGRRFEDGLLEQADEMEHLIEPDLNDIARTFSKITIDSPRGLARSCSSLKPVETTPSE